MRWVSAQGQVVAMTARNGTVHGYSYDAVGRLTADAVETLGTGVDGAIRRQEYRYDAMGRGTLLTAYDSAEGGAVVNEVRRAHNGLGQLVREWQSHAGVVDLSTTPSVQYAYTEAASGNHSRPESMTYPSGDEVVFGYGSGVDDAISRLTTVSEGGGNVEVLCYLGLGTVVKRTHAETGVNLSYLKQSGEADGEAGDRYTGLDRFGRIVDQRWVNSSNTNLDRYQYGYDRAGNRLFKDNTVISDLSEQYAYDALGQLTDYQQGTPAGAVTSNQSWDLDALGNWNTVTTDSEEMTREHNAQNEITNIGETTTLTYDANCNLTTDENEFQFRWDAWNRLVQVRDASDAVVARYGRDALGRRITVEQGEMVTDRYFSSEWQLLEESIDGATVRRHVWSPVYVDALVLRDRDTDGNGTLDERLYALQDANWNATALVSASGTVVEGYSYAPYGQATVRDGSGDVIAGSVKDWVFLHQGGEQIASGDYDFRNRAYSPSLGRWLSNDPIGFEADDNNWYRYEGNDPGNRLDPEGLKGTAVLPVYQPPIIRPPLGPEIKPPTTMPIWRPIFSPPVINMPYEGGTPLPPGYPEGKGPHLLPASGTDLWEKYAKSCWKDKLEKEFNLKDRNLKCSYYLEWCKWGAICKGKENGWKNSVGSCNSCYNKCLESGFWPFDDCPIAGKQNNSYGPRWPTNNDYWKIVWPNKNENGKYDCYQSWNRRRPYGS